MLLDEIQKAKLEYLSCVTPKYIELYGDLEPDLLFIGKSLLEHGFNEIRESITAEIIFIDEGEYIAWHNKKHLDQLIKGGQDGSSDAGYSLTEWYERGTPKPDEIFHDVFCDFEIKAYINKNK